MLVMMRMMIIMLMINMMTMIMMTMMTGGNFGSRRLIAGTGDERSNKLIIETERLAMILAEVPYYQHCKWNSNALWTLLRTFSTCATVSGWKASTVTASCSGV